MKEFGRALKMVLLTSVVTGLAYPLLMTGVAWIFFNPKANGSLIAVNGKIVGSELIGQNFTSARYFHGRPSAANDDASASNATNYGPTSAKFLQVVRERVRCIRAENRLSGDAPVPADLVTASGSGLDPDISVSGAMLQVPRVAKARGMSEGEVRRIVKENIRKPMFGFWGSERVNVLKLNLDLDRRMSHGR